jgi:hypothetical protein
MIGTIYIRSRPVRLGFLVNPRDAGEVKKAIQISSTLWGGPYNPFIPIFNRRTPKSWKDLPRTLAPETIVGGYISAYDPDVLIQCSKQIPDYIKKFGLQIVQSDEILNEFLKDSDNHLPKFGVSVLEVLSFIYDEHFRYSDRYRPRIVFPRIPARYALLWSALFGELPLSLTRG